MRYFSASILFLQSSTYDEYTTWRDLSVLIPVTLRVIRSTALSLIQSRIIANSTAPYCSAVTPSIGGFNNAVSAMQGIRAYFSISVRYSFGVLRVGSKLAFSTSRQTSTSNAYLLRRSRRLRAFLTSLIMSLTANLSTSVSTSTTSATCSVVRPSTGIHFAVSKAQGLTTYCSNSASKSTVLLCALASVAVTRTARTARALNAAFISFPPSQVALVREQSAFLILRGAVLVSLESFDYAFHRFA